MGVCGHKAARTASREVRFAKGYRYAPLSDGSISLGVSHEAEEKLDIIQFASAIFVAEEGKDFCISVMRLGGLEHEVRCHFRTEEGSGKAGCRYEHVEGDLVFEKGVFERTIDIRILENALWSATLEFKVLLEEPMRCQLGKYLKTCRVKVIDQDTFPSSFFAKELQEDLENAEAVNQMGLFIEYVKLVLSQPGNLWRFWITVLFDQVKNAYVWFTLKASVYMVNVVFGHKDGVEDELLVTHDPEKTAEVIGLMYVLLPLLLHIWKVTKVKLDLNGRCKLFLRTSVMRKYMNYSSASRREVTQPEVVSFVMQKSDHLASGIGEVSSLLETLGKLVMLNYFAVSSNPDMTWAVITMPVVMILWSILRDSHYVCVKPPEPCIKPISNFVSEICDNYSIIAYYFQRPAMNEKFAQRVTKFNENSIPEEVYKMNSEFFFDWLAPLFVGLYIAFYSPLVLAKELPLGTFLATISVFREVSSNFVDGYKGLKKVISCFDPLADMTIFLNRPTDVAALKSFVDHRVEETRTRRKEIMLVPTEATDFRTDLIPIRLDNISLTLNGREVFSNINLSVAQGKLVAVTGGAGSGKSKLLNVLAGDAVSSGHVLIPSHLRFVFVTHQVFVMASTPLQNLFFGDPSALTDFDERHRMFWILDKLKLTNVKQLAEQEMSLLQETFGAEDTVPEHCGCCYEDDVAKLNDRDLWIPEDSSQRAAYIRKQLAGWRNSLSFQEKAKLHMARALIMNPEILILEKPLMNLDEAESELLMTVLREFVTNRGVAMPLESRHLRRPRSCFFSAERPTTTSVDAIWDFTNGACVELQPGEQMEKGMNFARSPSGLSKKVASSLSLSARSYTNNLTQSFDQREMRGDFSP